MNIYFRKNFLATLPENQGGYLCRQLMKKRCRIRVVEGTLILQNKAALEAAKKILGSSYRP